METKDFSVASKSQLAKLLATENLVIQHQKMSTAKFDPVNRVLYCPIWKNMSGSLYDLLMGHEVGHALFTPADGWHDAVCNKGSNYKHFLNVVEDARIEKKIKKRYPGIRRSFIEGYSNLTERDFFGIQGKDINVLPFIDRVNLITKSSYTMDIQFSDIEQSMLEKVKNAETWNDVLVATEEIWNYSKDEQSQMLQDNILMNDQENEFGDEDDLDSESNNFEESDDESDLKKEVETSASEQDSDADEEEDDASNNYNRHKESMLSRSNQVLTDDFEPICETDVVYREQENSLLDEKSRPFIYVELPEPDLNKIITPHSRVQEQLTLHYTEHMEEEKRTNLLNAFKRKNERYISLLVKEFEMKKAADRYSKSKISTTGDLDISKLYKYKVDDTIFRKSMHVPKGKSHGLILLLDKSGSMHHNLKGSIEQILIMSMFCRKVNIPFSVYGFGNSENAYFSDKNSNSYGVDFFKPAKNTLSMNHVMLREYMNSKMSNSDFTNACKNMLCLGNSYGNYSGYYRTFPESEDLSNTPLCESLVACAKITNKFRVDNGVDIVNLVIINDGDSDNIGYYRPEGDIRRDKSTDPQVNNVILQDSKIKFQYQYRCSSELETAILKWYTAKTGAKIFGFFITDKGIRGIKNAIRNQYYENGISILDACKGDMSLYNDMMNKAYVTAKKNKFINSSKPGYHSFFLIPGGTDLVINDEELEIDTTKKVTSGRLVTAFRRFNEKRQLNRVLVNQFIEGIAK